MTKTNLFLLRNRAHIVNTALRFLQRGEVVGGATLSDLVDAERLGTLGHSRGGAAAVSAQFWPEADVDIKAVGCIAPVEGASIAASVPLAILYGALDDDVSSGDPIRIYERSTDQKTLVYIDGASHFHFTDDLTVDMAVADRETHRALAATYFQLFFDWHLKGLAMRSSVLSGDERPTPAEGRVSVQYDSGLATSLDLFDTPFDQLNRRGGVRLAQNLTLAVSGQELDLPQLGFFAEGSSGLVIAWDSNTDAILSLGLRGLSAVPEQILSMRVAQLRNLGRVSPLLEDVLFTLELADDAGQTAAVRSNSLGFHSTPFASRNSFAEANRSRKEVFDGLRLPMDVFLLANPQLNLNNLNTLTLHLAAFGGSLVLEDLKLDQPVESPNV